MKTDLMNLQELLSHKLFEVPLNQRGYSWEEQQLNALTEDLRLLTTECLWVGTVIVTTTSSDAKHRYDDDQEPLHHYTLEDGQQRLTAFYLLLQALRERLEQISGPKADIEALEKLIYFKDGALTKARLQNANTKLNQFFQDLLFSRSGGVTPTPSRPINLLTDAFNYAKEYFKSFDEKECLDWKRKALFETRWMLLDLASENVNRYLAFESINARGLPLSQFEKIKNYCLLLKDKTPVLHLADRAIETSWYQSLEKLEEYKVSTRSQEETFASELFGVLTGQVYKNAETHEKFVHRYHKLLEGSRDPSLEKELNTFIDFWVDYAESFGFVATEDRDGFYGKNTKNRKAKEWLVKIDNLDLKTIMRPVLVAGHIRYKPNDFKELVKACEIYVFRVHAVENTRKHYFRREIYLLAKEILLNNQSLRQTLRWFCQNMEPTASLAQMVATLSDGNPKYAGVSKGWAHSYYFLYEYEMSFGRGTVALPYATDKETKINSQEHILPQQHRDGAWWEHQWPNESEADRFMHRLGNLVLTGGNSTLGRKEIALKLKDSSAPYDYCHRTSTASEKEIKNFTDGTKWGRDEILKRERHLLEFAVKRWAIPCVGDGKPINLPEVFEDFGGRSLTIPKLGPGVDAEEDSEEIYGADDGSKDAEKKATRKAATQKKAAQKKVVKKVTKKKVAKKKVTEKNASRNK